jgi:plastocyanin
VGKGVVYTLPKGTQANKSRRRRNIGVAVIAVVLAVAVGVVVFIQISAPLIPTVNMTLYGGTNGVKYGFSFDTRIDSPGPTLTFKVGDVVNMTFINTDPQYPHNWAIVDSRQRTVTALFNSQTVDVPSGGNVSVVFRVPYAGNFYYGCLNGDIAYGMWGNVVVNP